MERNRRRNGRRIESDLVILAVPAEVGAGGEVRDKTKERLLSCTFDVCCSNRA
jgi:hypothetical protein